MYIKDRYIETIICSARELKEHPQNWRRHPESQQRAMDEIFHRIGKTTALQGTRLADGSIQIFDGHLRKDLLKDEDVRVDIYDLTQQEVLYVLATHDPVSTMAEADQDLLDSLLSEVGKDLPGDIAGELEKLLDSTPSSSDTEYTKKVEAPIYEPKGEQPHVLELYDESKTNRLISEIEQQGITGHLRDFLIAAARRHTIFNYQKIADFYAQADPEIQSLMEDSALVIIDFNRAIELGYVQVSDAMMEQLHQEYPDEE